MIFPFESLSEAQRETGLAVGTLVGFAFGFVLERAGFGRAQKLAAQFYGTDLTVLKVMFSAIVTALLGLVVLGGVGLVDFQQLADQAASGTFLWPMIAGGLALGVGFIVSGYCPGTSFVAAASGKLDGLVVVLGVIVGQVVYAELEPRPWLAKFHTSGDLGHFYLSQWLHLPRALVAALVVALAVGAFLFGEWVEGKRAPAAHPDAAPTPAGRPGRRVFAGFATASGLGLLALALPQPSEARPQALLPMTQLELARRIVEQPWNVRIVDLRPREQCAAQRIPGAECARVEDLQLQGERRDVVLVAAGAPQDVALVAASTPQDVPRVAVSTPQGMPLVAVGALPLRAAGRLFVLQGGFEGWREFALTAPPPTLQDRDLYRARAALHAAMTGLKAAPPPPVPTGGAAAPKKGGGGGCGG